MGKWLGNLINVLLALAATTLLSALLKGPIDELVSGDHLTAEVQLSPWVPQPSNLIDQKNKKPIDSLEVSGIQDVIDYSVPASSSILQFSKITVMNGSSKIIQNGNIRFRSSDIPSIAVVSLESDKRIYMKKPSRVNLPEMKPGDKVLIFAWFTALSTYDVDQIISTYSSQGKFRISYDWPSNQREDYESGIAKFIDNWGFTIFTWLVLTILLLLWIVVAMNSEYRKAPLSSEKFFYKERERFEQDMAKFTPDYSGATAAIGKKS